jgi:hypothetical protein
MRYWLWYLKKQREIIMKQMIKDDIPGACTGG